MTTRLPKLLLLLLPCIASCNYPDQLTPYEYRDITRAEALKIIPNIPKDTEHIYIKRISTSDSSMLYMKYGVTSNDSLLQFKEILSKKIKLVQSNALPSYWPGYNSLPFSQKPIWWEKCSGTQYYYDMAAGSDRKHRDRSEGVACCVDSAKNVISFWHWNLKGWGIDRGNKK